MGLRMEDLWKPQVVIIDFGFAHIAGTCTFQSGTPGYMPPEAFQIGTWTSKGDVFSAGVVITQMMSNRVPVCPDGGSVRYGVFTAGVHSLEEIAIATATRDLSPLFEHLPSEYTGLRDLLPSWLRKIPGTGLG